MTGLEITLLCTLMVVVIVSAVVIIKLLLEFKGYKQGAQIIISQLASQLHYQQTQMEFYQHEQEHSYTSMH